jgi:enediyne biosynthesis protein E4
MPKILVILLIILVAGCARETESDKTLRQYIHDNKLDEPYVADLPALPENKAIADLGGALFFSPDLSIDGSVSCASCHHPQKAGGDGISLPIGIGGEDSKNIGEDRIKAAEKNRAANIVEGLIPRNTPTVFNVSLYTKVLFWDGRTEYITTDDNRKVIKTGFGISPLIPTPYEQTSLLQTQARMPISSFFEMKGWLEPNKNNHEIEQGVISFLQAQPVWCEKFNAVFKKTDCQESISLPTLTQALAEFQATLVFTDSPFEEYIEGKKSALNEEQKKGALLFFGDIEKGGMGCSNCHSGKFFTDEKFYNLGLPASGRGANENGWDYGRHNVDPLAARFSFRTPHLLNISTAEPYFHNGTALTLADAIKFHATNPQVKKNAHIIELQGIDYEKINAVIKAEFLADKNTFKLLPDSVTEEQLGYMVAFLESLTDPCITTPDCMLQFTHEIIESPRETKKQTADNFFGNKPRSIDLKTVKAPKLDCENMKAPVAKGSFNFTAHDKDVGITHQRTVGLVRMGWLLDVVNYGGVSASDVDYDCLDDLIFDAGEKGLVFYRQNKDGSFTRKSLPLAQVDGAISPLMMDVDGDYKYDLFVGTSGQSLAHIAYDFTAKNDLMYFNTLTGPVINASSADIDLDGDIDIALAFWRSFKSLQQDHLWWGDGAGNLVAHTKLPALRTSEDNITNTENDLIRRKHETPLSESDLTFSPNFVDIDNDGDQDLLLASDFNRSQVLLNEAGNFSDITDKAVINDNNGMGVAIADFKNRNAMDWYVTSIYRGDSGGRTGNHLYGNQGKGLFIKDTKAIKLPEKPEWSWGSCAADFNNDGYQDIFYVSGFGEDLKTARYEKPAQQKASEAFQLSYRDFSASTPRMLINNKKGGFDDVSQAIGFNEPFDGRGISCFDYQQDGDIDIIVNPLEGAPRLYINQLNGSKNWLSVRLLGLPGNTEALGTKIILHTTQGKQYREVRFENNYLSRNPSQVHFGLDELNAVEKLELVFPAPHSKSVIIENPAINLLHIINQ